MKPTLRIFFSALGVISTLCLAETRDYGNGLQNFSQPHRLDNRQGTLNHWSGIGRLSINGTVCTAALIYNRDGTPLKSTSAYVLTSGHCIDHSNGKIITDSTITGTVTFNYFTDPKKNNAFPLKRVKWRSMQGVDMAILELDTNMHILIKHGISPLKLARLMPPDGSDVLIVGIPQGRSLQMSACTFEPATDIVEGKWTWRNNLMTRCKGFTNGASGSPLLNRYTNEIIGVIGTYNEDISSLTPCDIDAPCTLNANGYQATGGNVYGHPTTFLTHCFHNGVMVDNAGKCELYPRFSVSLENETPQTKAIETTSDGEVLPAGWDVGFSIDTAFYRYKIVRTAKNCELRNHYSELMPAANARIKSEIGSEPGHYFLCILGMSQGQRFSQGLLKNALSIPVVLTRK